MLVTYFSSFVPRTFIKKSISLTNDLGTRLVLWVHCHVESMVSVKFHLLHRHEILIYLQGTCEHSLNRGSETQHFECCDTIKYPMKKPPLFVCVLFEGLTTDSVSMTMGDLCNVLECRVKVANSGNIRYVKSLSVLGGCCVR